MMTAGPGFSIEVRTVSIADPAIEVIDPNVTPYMVPRMDSLPRCSYYFWYAASLYHIMA